MMKGLVRLNMCKKEKNKSLDLNTNGLLLYYISI